MTFKRQNGNLNVYRAEVLLESWIAGELESWRAGELESWRAGELLECWRKHFVVQTREMVNTVHTVSYFRAEIL